MSPPVECWKPTILIAPLDWGLGHATRIIPVVHSLISLGCRILMGVEGKTKILLQKEFPDLIFLDLPGYRIRYSRRRWTLPGSASSPA